MSNLDNKPKPGIDNQYWFDFSRLLIDKSLESYNNSAEKIKELIQWVIPIYTGTSVLGFSFSEMELTKTQSIIIISPILLLILTYLSAQSIQFSRRFEFDPRSPKEIKKAYHDLNNSKYINYIITVILTLLSTILICYSLYTFTIINNLQSNEESINTSLNITYLNDNIPNKGDKILFFIEGSFNIDDQPSVDENIELIVQKFSVDEEDNLILSNWTNYNLNYLIHGYFKIMFNSNEKFLSEKDYLKFTLEWIGKDNNIKSISKIVNSHNFDTLKIENNILQIN